MKKLTAQQIRETWFRFFKERGHQQIDSVSLVPHNDPTLLWINSGVAGLKAYFDGSVIPQNPRLVNIQKSIRTNDIENVGKTARHHTFFEMMGNFSIGDYFRETTLPWAIELLTAEQYFGMPLENLYFTYHPNDLETYQTWLKAGVSKDHLIALAGNYWEIGEGPAGPNTEVFFDRGPSYDPNNEGLSLLRQDIDNERYVEIWGIVFSQYNAKAGLSRDEYQELPSKNIDTGAGLERIASIIQNTPTNFETDLFMPLIKAVEKISNKKYEKENLMSFRVIVDHIRALTFALSDGAVFANEGRGYVLRRLLRRAMRYGQKIGINEPFLYQLVDSVVDNYKVAYPTLEKVAKKVKKSILTEENKFINTLSAGEKLLTKLLSKQTMLSGDDAFKLYDTYGFPLDLTLEIAEESDVEVDVERFNELLEAQRIRARTAREKENSMSAQSADLLNFRTEDQFLYGTLEPLQSKVIGLFKDGVAVNQLNDEGEIVVETTNFYAESGGQVGDRGVISNDVFSGAVIDTTPAPHGQHLHHVKVSNGQIKVGDDVLLELDTNRRRLIMRNHSVTHLLNAALTEILSEDIQQAGSFVGPDYLRFDINYNGPIPPEKLQAVEEKVNQMIAASLVQKTEILELAEAKQSGAKSLFDEKYGETVRVVSFGDYSKEFCGGTHVQNTNEIGLFVIEHERAIAAGVRRIEARTSLNAYRFIKEQETLLDEARDLLVAGSYSEVPQSIKTLQKSKEHLKEDLSHLQDKVAGLEAKKLRADFKIINGVHVLIKYLKGYSRNAIGQVIDALKNEYENSIIVLIGEEEANLPINVYVSEAAQKVGHQAGQYVKAVAKLLGGSGGGRAGFASGAGQDASRLGEVNALMEGLING